VIRRGLAGHPTRVSPSLEAEDPPLVAGDVAGELVVERLLGEGAFGRVYRAVHPVIGKLAAVKVLRSTLSRQPDAVRRFLNEARAVSRIQNQHIVKVFGFGSLPDGRLFTSMELCEGCSLEAYLASSGKLPREEALTILTQLGRALDAAHQAGITHRDVKPDNIFVTRDEDGGLCVKLLDFGIAKLAEGTSGELAVTTKGMLLGTPSYMSPEQIRGDVVTPRADVYALGVLAFELLTGRLPFAGLTPVAVMTDHLQREPPRASSFDPTLSRSLDRGIGAMLSKRPEDRPACARAAVQALLDAPRTPEARAPLPRATSADGASNTRGGREDLALGAGRDVDPLAATLANPAPSSALARLRQRPRVPALFASLFTSVLALLAVLASALRR
jgi:eukaryotic-like serine/threonine-protein kinase